MRGCCATWSRAALPATRRRSARPRLRWKISLRGLRKNQCHLPPFRERQAIIFCVLANALNVVLGLCTCCAVRLTPDHPVYALAIDHNVHSEYTITGGAARKQNSLLRDGLGKRQSPHRVPREN